MNRPQKQPPYLRAQRHTLSLMIDVCIALMPPCVAAVWFFRLPAVWMLLTSSVASLLADRLAAWWRKHPYPFDGSALVTGLILALSCPASIPLPLLAVLSASAVLLFRELFGGIGDNLFNPAMAARALLLTAFPAYATGYALPDTVSAATPLVNTNTPLPLLILGRVGGSIGETSVPMLLVGAGYLLYRRVIRWQTPVLSLASFVLVIFLCGGDPLRHLLSGSILFGAVYIFTDYTGRPTTAWGESAFAVGAGALTALFRLFGRYPEGVCFAVLGMNLLTPLLEYLTHSRVYGTKRKERTA